MGKFDSETGANGGKNSSRKGVPNKAGKSEKQKIEEVLAAFDSETLMAKLTLIEDPKDFIVAYDKFLQYLLPKQREQKNTTGYEDENLETLKKELQRRLGELE